MRYLLPAIGLLLIVVAVIAAPHKAKPTISGIAPPAEWDEALTLLPVTGGCCVWNTDTSEYQCIDNLTKAQCDAYTDGWPHQTTRRSRPRAL